MNLCFLKQFYLQRLGLSQDDGAASLTAIELQGNKANIEATASVETQIVYNF